MRKYISTYILTKKKRPDKNNSKKSIMLLIIESFDSTLRWVIHCKRDLKD